MFCEGIDGTEDFAAIDAVDHEGVYLFCVSCTRWMESAEKMGCSGILPNGY